MPNIAQVLKAEISRLARKEIRLATALLRKDNARLKRDTAALKRRMKRIEADSEFLISAERRRAQAVQPSDPAQLQGIRVTAKTIRSLRRKLLSIQGRP